jgi:hypothetical protein
MPPDPPAGAFAIRFRNDAPSPLLEKIDKEFAQGIDKLARRVYVHCTPHAEGSNP